MSGSLYSHVLGPLILTVLSGSGQAQELLPVYNPPGSNVHCHSCPAGTRIREHCTEDLKFSECANCTEFHFSDKPNSKTHCTPCKSGCPKNGYEIASCTAKTNKGCKCNDGYHKFPVDRYDPHWKCRPHSKCPEGEGEVYYGNHTHNTECQTCGNDQFVNKTDPDHPRCQDCMQCGPGVRILKGCTAEQDTNCDDHQDGDNVTYSVDHYSTSSLAPSSTSPSSGASDNSDSETLNGGEIFGIVFVVLLVILGIFASCVVWKMICSYNAKEVNRQRQFFNGTIKKIVWVVGIVFGLGLFFALGIFIFFRRRKRQDAAEDGESGVPLTNPVDAENHVAQRNPSSFNNDAGGAENAVPLGNPDDVNNAPGDGENDDPPGDPEGINNAPGDAENPGGANAAANVENPLPWELDFIHREVFPILCERLGSSWKSFIRQLPGWDPESVEAFLAYTAEENPTVKERIHRCLVEWQEKCRDYVTKENILRALEAPSVNMNALKQRLENLHA